MIYPYDEDKVKYASYDLSVGKEYKLTSSNRVIPVYTVVEIPPYEVCLILAKEKIKLPNNVCAFLFSRNRAAKEGFLMHPQAPIEPGSTGGIYILLHNISNKTINLYKDEHLATIVFQFVNPCPQVYGDDKKDDKYLGKENLEELIGNNTYTPALKQVSDSIAGWNESLLSKYIPIMLVLTTIVLAILTLVSSVKYFVETEL
jgi:deoxycytidine triphosphate deaminase